MNQWREKFVLRYSLHLGAESLASPQFRLFTTIVRTDRGQSVYQCSPCMKLSKTSGRCGTPPGFREGQGHQLHNRLCIRMHQAYGTHCTCIILHFSSPHLLMQICQEYPGRAVSSKGIGLIEMPEAGPSAQDTNRGQQRSVKLNAADRDQYK